MLNKKILGSSMALAFALVALCLGFDSESAQRKPANGSAAAADVLSYLPASDGIALIDVRRLMNETMPRILAGDPAKLAQANAEIEKFKMRTGIDPHVPDSKQPYLIVKPNDHDCRPAIFFFAVLSV